MVLSFWFGIVSYCALKYVYRLHVRGFYIELFALLFLLTCCLLLAVAEC